MPSILVLDDRPETVTMLRMFLKPTGYQIVGGGSGEEGLDYLQTAPELPVLILCDLLMPQMDGLAFLREIRGDDQWKHIPFVIMTAASERLYRQEIIDSGVDAFISKPFRLTDIQRVMSNLGIANVPHP
jgi:CheY-like chemotaxis protein